MTKMISHSEKIKENFIEWIKGWDERINTHDDNDSREILKNKMKRGWAVVSNLLNKSDEKAMIKASSKLIIGSNEANEKEVLAMIENQKKQWYKDLKNVRDDLVYLMCVLENIYEIKNRKSHENFELRAENAKLRKEINELKDKA